MPLIGHHHTERTILDAWHSGRIPHAWLITGPRGIGKAMLAERFARFALAQGKQGLLDDSLHIDDNHPVARRMESGGHGDLLVLSDKKDGEAGKIAVEDARKVGAFLRLTPSEAQYRVVIIDSIDSMNRNAANALLKVLEEPPANTLLLLVSHMPGTLLPTIRSRCRTLKMQPLEQQDFAKVMRSTADDISAEDLSRLYHLTEGSPGMALTLYAAGGLEYYRDIISILERFEASKVHSLGDKLASKSEAGAWNTVQFMLGSLFHTMTYIASGKTAKAELVAGEHQLIHTMLAKSPLESWLEVWEKIREWMQDAERAHLDRKHVTINMFSALAGVR